MQPDTKFVCYYRVVAVASKTRCGTGRTWWSLVQHCIFDDSADTAAGITAANGRAHARTAEGCQECTHTRMAAAIEQSVGLHLPSEGYDWSFSGNCHFDPLTVTAPGFLNWPIACWYDFLRCSCVTPSPGRYTLYIICLGICVFVTRELGTKCARGLVAAAAWLCTCGYCCGKCRPKHQYVLAPVGGGGGGGRH
jgi:hypothetical protein